MVNFFAKKGAANIIFLFAYALFLKAIFFLKPQPPLVHFTDGLLYKQCLHLLSLTNNANVWANVLAFFLLFIQALMISKLVMSQKLLLQPNYLAGMCFLLLSSFFPDWHLLSSTLIVNFILLFVWQMISSLQNTSNAKSLLFNIGMLICIANFFYSFSFLFLFLVIIALLIYRSFKLNEYLILLIGYCTLYYLYYVWQYLTDKFYWKNIRIPYNLAIPKIENVQLIFIAFMLAIGLVILGFYTVQNNSSKMPIQSRKSWSLMFFWVLISFIVPVFNNNIYYWSTSILPASTFVAAMFFYIKNKKARAALHWGLFAFAIYVTYLSK